MKAFGFVLATKMLVDGKKKVRFMYHETPDGPKDSGWRFFSGDEDDEYVLNPDNIGLYHISSILEIDPQVEPYLSAPVGFAFEREDIDKPFVVREDFVPGKGVE